MKSRILAVLLGLASVSTPAWAKDKDPPADSTPDVPSKTDADKKDQAPEPAPASSDEGDATVRGLSWDLLAGGVPSSGALIEGELGFSALPRVAYHYTLAPQLSVGGMVSFDYAYWVPNAAFTPALLLQVPVRYSLYRSATTSIGVRGDPGIAFSFSSDKRPFFFGVLLNASISAGFTLQNRFIVGGTLAIPIAYAIPTNGTTTDVIFPLLIGPFLEFHVTPPLALTFDLKMGPTFNSASAAGTLFGLAMMVGIAYRM
jgi:hypothetical protein